MLSSCPNLVAYKSGHDIFISFPEDVGTILQNTYTEDSDDEGTYLTKTANIIRREILNSTVSFEGHFDENCQATSVPKALVTLLSMIMNGSQLTLEIEHDNVYNQQACLSVAQLLVFNTYKRRRKLVSQNFTKHSKKREPPLPVHIGLLIHSQTRQSNLVSDLYNLGLSISYEHVLEIENLTTNAICEQFKADRVVCPPKLRKNIFTTAAYDNIDHNPSSTTAKEAFHGTGISVFQHPDYSNLGAEWEKIPHDNSLSKERVELPGEYTSLLPACFLKKDIFVPKIIGWNSKDSTFTAEIMELEMEWLNQVVENIEHNDSLPLSWSAYNAKYVTNINIIKSISSVLPLFKEDSYSVSLMTHAMQLIEKVTNFLNPGQTPVLVFEQPLYAIAKAIQWNMPNRFGENQFVIMLGGLHIEMGFLALIGSFVTGSGWVEALEGSGVATSGKADSFIRGAHVKRSRYAHQVNGLFIILTVE